LISNYNFIHSKFACCHNDAVVLRQHKNNKQSFEATAYLELKKSSIVSFLNLQELLTSTYNSFVSYNHEHQAGWAWGRGHHVTSRQPGPRPGHSFPTRSSPKLGEAGATRRLVTMRELATRPTAGQCNTASLEQWVDNMI